MNRPSPHLLLVVFCLVTFLSLAPWAFPAVAEEPEASVGEVETEGVDLERQYVKLGDIVLFVPELLLAERELEDLPLGHSRMSLEQRMEWWRNPPDPPLNATGVVPKCWLPSGYGPGKTWAIESLGRFVDGSDLIVLGSIESVVVGWDVRASEVVRMAYLELDEVIRARGRRTITPRADSTVVFSTTGGELTVEDVPICTLDDPQEYDPKVGDRVLVMSTWQRNSGLLEPAIAFLVEGGIVRGGEMVAEDLPLLRLREILGDSESVEY